jgi:dihydroorotase-like cyclic amidohydrolase
MSVLSTWVFGVVWCQETLRSLRRCLQQGVVGFKCFLVPSGVDEFEHVTEADLREAMPELARLGALLIVHASCRGRLMMVLAVLIIGVFSRRGHVRLRMKRSS